MNRTFIKIFDTTLRDGEQSPGCSMDVPEKLRMAEQLARLNVNVIEAGFPIASVGDFEAVSQVASQIRGPVIAGLARAKAIDIDKCYEALKKSDRPRIHTFIATSDIHLEHKLKMTRAQVLEATREAVRLARKHVEDVEFSAEDATRSDWAFLAEVFTLAIEEGATTINIPDTVGYTVPSEFKKIIRYLKEHVPNIEGVTMSVHCHNDLGLAVANSLAAVEEGVRQIECTINGIGERAGNASLEEIVMIFKVRQQLMNCETQVVTEQLHPASRLLTHITGVAVQPNKAIVGSNAFAHEAGIHQAGVLKKTLTYEIMTPESVGLSGNKLVLGKHSGRNAFRDKIQKLGLQLKEEELNQAFDKFKDLADKKKDVYDDDIEALVLGQKLKGVEKYRLVDVEVTSGIRVLPKAMVAIQIGHEMREETADGDGPVDAIFQAIKKITGFQGHLNQFTINALTGGTDAQGEVMVALQDKGRVIRGVGSHTDIVVASAMAYIHALNRLDSLSIREKEAQGV